MSAEFISTRASLGCGQKRANLAWSPLPPTVKLTPTHRIMKPVPAHLLRLPLLTLGVLSLSIPLLHAQSTAAPVRKDDEVIELSPFVVNTESEEGYYSPQAVSGTRTRTEL